MHIKSSPSINIEDEKRFWSKVNKTLGCWEWTAAKIRGYGIFWVDGSTHRANRIAWAIHHGTDPGPLNVLHSCDNPGCVRPTHLFLGTDLDNMKDRDNKGRHGLSKRTHCKHGHEYTVENTRWYKGYRFCRECTKRENKNQALKRGEGKGRIYVLKSHCVRGHAFTDGSFYLVRGNRVCKECARIRSKK